MESRPLSVAARAARVGKVRSGIPTRTGKSARRVAAPRRSLQPMAYRVAAAANGFRSPSELRRNSDGDRNPFAAAATRYAMGCNDRRGAATLRADFPVRVGIPDRTFPTRAARAATESGLDSIYDRLRRGLHLYGTAQSGHGPSPHRHAREVRAGLRICLLLCVCLYRMHHRLVADLCDLRQRRAGTTATDCCFPGPLDRLWLDRRQLPRPDAAPPGRFGLPDRRSPHARYSVLVLLCSSRGT